ncbi:MAG TPA: TRAFs-binding domain-containing protein [Thermoleophilaceae bacterium]|jgi:tetratricopeptide (TPR) repeat protein
MSSALPPLCFVVMPFGVKPDGQGGAVDFDAVYEQLIAPAIEEAGLYPLRADQELVGGIVHKPMFERLILADYAVADLTTVNANVFYELGVRHAVRPYSTVLIGADVKRTPFDLAPDRVRPYSLDHSGRPANAEHDRATLVEALRHSRHATTDSPVFQLIDDLPTPEIDRLKTDVFREQAAYSVQIKRRLTDARAEGPNAVRALEHELGPLEDVEAGVIVDLLLSYRATQAWEDMIRLVEGLLAPLRAAVLIREQYGFALNRAGRREEAEAELRAVVEEHGPSSETYGLLGRVYKDRWEAERAGSVLRAAGHLDQAIDAYRRGFETDWRDAYPGVNAVTLMEIREPGGSAQAELLPVVRYACLRRIEGGSPDYWDHATRLELGVIARDADEATLGARAALAAVRESWEPASTAYNLSLIRESRAERDEVVAWADEIEAELKRAGEDA